MQDNYLSATRSSRLDGLSLAPVTRRLFLFGAIGSVAGCAVPAKTSTSLQAAAPPPVDPHYAAMYAALPDERFAIPAVDVSSIDPIFLRQEVSYSTDEQPGTIIVDPDARFLYLVLESGLAMRYGVGVGREGFGWTGSAVILRKAEWPTWTPPRSMIERDPSLAQYAGGMAPGLVNPLGARALYLYQNGVDTLYRLHGTNEPWSIGLAVSSGCIRMFNQDAIDLYNRTPIATRVVVLPHSDGEALI